MNTWPWVVIPRRNCCLRSNVEIISALAPRSIHGISSKYRSISWRVCHLVSRSTRKKKAALVKPKMAKTR